LAAVLPLLVIDREADSLALQPLRRSPICEPPTAGRDLAGQLAGVGDRRGRRAV